MSPLNKIKSVSSSVSSRVNEINLFPHIIPVLCRVHSRLQGCSPRGSIYARPFVPWALYRLPINEKCDRIFGLLDAIVRFPSGNACSRTSDDTCRDSSPLEYPATDIYMMRR